MERYTYTLEKFFLVSIRPRVNTTFIFGGYLDFGLKYYLKIKQNFFTQIIILTGYLPVRASGSKPFFKALCLSCCFCLSFNSLSCRNRRKWKWCGKNEVYSYLHRSPDVFAFLPSHIFQFLVWRYIPRVLELSHGVYLH